MHTMEPGLQEVGSTRGKHGQGAWLWFLREGTGETGLEGSGLARLSDFSGLWGVGLSSCLAPGLGVIKAGE